MLKTQICVTRPQCVNFVDPNSWIDEGNFARDGLHLNGRGKIGLEQKYARVSGLDVGGSVQSKK